MIIGKVRVKCNISFFVKMCQLLSTSDSIVQNHIRHLMMFTQNISLYRSKRTDYRDQRYVNKHLLLGLPQKICKKNKILLQQLNPLWCSGTGDGFRSQHFGVRSSLIPLNLVFFLIYMESNAVILYKFWRPQPTLPCLGLQSGLQYSFSKKTSAVVSLSSMQGVFAESSLRKQSWRIEDCDCKLLLLLL